MFFIGRDIGLAVTIWDMLVLFPPVLLLSMVPFSVAGWGVREGAMVTGMGLIGVSPAAAFTVSVLYGIVMVAVGLADPPRMPPVVSTDVMAKLMAFWSGLKSGGAASGPPKASHASRSKP